jgi:two-component system, OmpR family, sensor histidine kinase KdpD
MTQLALRLLISLAGVTVVTFSAYSIIPHNPTSVGFAYLLLVLLLASTWGLVEATVASVAATLAFNFFFLPPIGKFTIADPQNWVALFSFLTTALITSRLSARVKKQALDAVDRQRDIERLYTFSRAILLIDPVELVAKQLARKLAEVFGLRAAVLYDRRTGEIHRAGPSDFDGLEDQLRDAASQGTSFFDPEHQRLITAVRLGSEPIASFAITLATPGEFMQDSVLQGISNLIAIGLERARAGPGPSSGGRAPQRAASYHADRRDGARVQDAAHLHPRRHNIVVVIARTAHRSPHGAARSGG